MENMLCDIIRVALGNCNQLSHVPTEKEWSVLYEETEKQAIVGITLTGLERLPSEQRPPIDLLLQWIGVGQMIQQWNVVMDSAVVRLCKLLDGICARYLIVKGQTLNAVYPVMGVRQSGDIDFLIHPHDWDKVYTVFANELGENAIDIHSEKHLEWEKEGITYEMHRWLNDFASKKDQRYWDEVVMKEVWRKPYTVKIDGYDVHTLAPTYNVIFVFVHLFYHLINEGVGLRQFVDWYVLIDSLEFNAESLERHLNGIGLYDAFCGCGALLTDYLGLTEDKFPFEINENNHKRAHKIVENILKVGNFGHNRQYVQPHGVIHGLQQMGSLIEQCWKFGYLAPSESWGYILVKIRWWGKKLSKKI